MLRNSPGDIFRLVDRPQFLAVRQGLLPMHDVFQAWLTDQQNKTYFFAMKQIAHKLYIGAEVATETLKQRFNGVLQKGWNPTTRKNEYHTVAEYHNEFLSLLNEVRDMDPATEAANSPQKDTRWTGLHQSVMGLECLPLCAEKYGTFCCPCVAMSHLSSPDYQQERRCT